MSPMVWRVAPTFSASSICESPASIRAVFMRRFFIGCLFPGVVRLFCFLDVRGWVLGLSPFVVVRCAFSGAFALLAISVLIECKIYLTYAIYIRHIWKSRGRIEECIMLLHVMTKAMRHACDRSTECEVNYLTECLHFSPFILKLGHYFEGSRFGIQERKGSSASMEVRQKLGAAVLP